tara:strand:+ start:1158 stop:1733 length:576 start_codon:yes stop_codon:yes gene_type:complete
MAAITPEQRAKIDAQNLANIVKKASAGKVLTERDIGFLDTMATREQVDGDLGIWNTTQVAQMIGVTPKTVNEHARGGVIPKIGRGKFDPINAVSSYCKWLRQQREEATGSGKSLTAARTELAVEDTRLKRLQAEKLEGKLCDVDIILDAENKLLSGISSIIRNSDIEDGRKEDIFTAIRDHGDAWKEEMSE